MCDIWNAQRDQSTHLIWRFYVFVNSYMHVKGCVCTKPWLCSKFMSRLRCFLWLEDAKSRRRSSLMGQIFAIICALKAIKKSISLEIKTYVKSAFTGLTEMRNAFLFIANYGNLSVWSDHTTPWLSRPIKYVAWYIRVQMIVSESGVTLYCEITRELMPLAFRYSAKFHTNNKDGSPWDFPDFWSVERA